ncbi:MAG: DUF3108 domain-containing protein, partial [Bacteroidota bacterium]
TFTFSSDIYSDMIYPGEDLLYEVSYMGIKLGEIRLVTYGPEMYDGKAVIHTKSFMDSYSGIPFVSLHTTFETWMDPSITHTHKFHGNTKLKDGTWEFVKIIFDEEDKLFRYEVWKHGRMDTSRTLYTNHNWNDGLSLIFYARQFVKSKRTFRVPTIMQNDTSYTIINNKNKIENVEISAVDYPVRTVFFNGKAEWSGVYGVTGNYEGWFSDDDARVPIIAKMKLYIGYAKLELIKWKRGNWAPPRAQ